MTVFSLDYTSGVAPLTVRARLFTVEFTTWRWLLNGVIHKPDDDVEHVFTLDQPGVYQIAVRGVTRSGQVVQDDTGPVVLVAAPAPVFRYGMQTFGPIVEAELAMLASRGYTLCRVEAPAELARAVRGAASADGAVVALRDYYAQTTQLYEAHRLACHWVIEPQEAPYLPDGSACDVMNEMNIGWRDYPRMTPSQYRQRLLLALESLLPRHCRPYAGVASDMDTSAVEWTRQVVAGGLPPGVGVAWHRYPKDNAFTAPKKGWASRAAELAGVKAANGGRPFMVTEYCYPSQYVVEYLWGLVKRTRTLPQEEQLRLERLECAYWRAQGAEAVFRYQIRDAVGESFGARMLNQQWRQVINVPLGG